MPEESEIETHELHETLEEMREEREERERDEKVIAWTRWISLSTAICAVIAAVAALQSGTLVNEALLSADRAVLSQTQASDAWNYYQATGLKARGASQTAAILAAANVAESAARWSREARRYDAKQADLMKQARDLEERGKRSTEDSERLMESHHMFAYCVTFTQVAIALSAVAALTRRRPVWYISLALGSVGTALLCIGYIRTA